MSLWPGFSTNYNTEQDDFSLKGLELFLPWKPWMRQSSPSSSKTNRLSDDLTGPGLLPEGVGSLAGEPDHKVILALLLQDKLLDVLDGLGDGDPLDAGLPPQLLHHLALLLDTRHFYRLSLVEVNQAI